MKRSAILPILFALLALSATGCDFFRKVAGRPTAAELENTRFVLQQEEEAQLQARLDSMEQARKRMADSLAALEAHLLDSLSQAKGTILNPAKLGGLYTTKLETRYCIVVGAFRTRSYAERKLTKCQDAGYTATIISFRNGLLAVAVCPSDDLNVTLRKLRELRGKGICPEDGWILVNE